MEKGRSILMAFPENCAFSLLMLRLDKCILQANYSGENHWSLFHLEWIFTPVSLLLTSLIGFRKSQFAELQVLPNSNMSHYKMSPPQIIYF